jgi:pyrimidine operon attenuation protein / uracil phosphoribosyltransferase
MKQLILNSQAIEQKIKRMATQIAEANFAENEIVLLGILDSGYYLAQLLTNELQAFNKKIHLGSIGINKPQPLSSPIELNIDKKLLDGKCIVIVDDVANSGKTVFYALQPLLSFSPAKVQVAVLVDRQHKQFPISADFVGHSLSTTLQEMIYVEIGEGVKEPQAYIS